MNITTLTGCAIAALAVLPSFAVAQDGWPQQPISVIVPYPPGGNTDLIARTLAEPLSVELGQPVVVENRAGAGGSVGMGEAAGAAPDGYTLVLGDIATMGINPHIYDNLRYSAEDSFDPVIQITSIPLVLGVGPRLEVTDVSDLIAQAKADPELLEYASSGVGTAQHLAFEYFKSLTGIEALHIPFNGAAPARTAVIAGEVAATIDGTLVPSIKEGSIQALAVTADKRVEALPDVPTMTEMGVDMVYTSWHGLFAPAGTDPQVIEQINTALNKIMQRPEVVERFTALNINLVGGSPEDFGAFVTEQSGTLGDLVDLSGAAER